MAGTARTAPPSPGSTFLAWQALLQYAEGHRGNATTFGNASQAVLAHLLEQRRRMPGAPLSSWARARWLDMAHTAAWVLDHAEVGGHEGELLELINLLHDQGYAWDEWYETAQLVSHDNMLVHNVNLAQACRMHGCHAMPCCPRRLLTFPIWRRRSSPLRCGAAPTPRRR